MRKAGKEEDEVGFLDSVFRSIVWCECWVLVTSSDGVDENYIAAMIHTLLARNSDT